MTKIFPPKYLIGYVSFSYRFRRVDTAQTWDEAVSKQLSLPSRIDETPDVRLNPDYHRHMQHLTAAIRYAINMIPDPIPESLLQVFSQLNTALLHAERESGENPLV